MNIFIQPYLKPGKHAIQAVSSVCAGKLLYLPNPQDLQSSAELAPSFSLHFPRLHSLHAFAGNVGVAIPSASLYLPLSQNRHVLLPE